MILIIGDPADLSAAYVGWLAEQRGAQVRALAEDRLGLEWSFRISAGRPSLTLDAGIVPLDEVSGAYVRLNPEPTVPPELGLAPEVEWLYVQERRAGLEAFIDALPFRVVNRPSSGRANGSKPFQMSWLSGRGFAVPRWTATNEPETAAAFIASSPAGAIVKACSGLRCHVRRVTDEVLENMRVGTSPVVLQDYVPGRDVRVHVVDDQVYPTLVDVAEIDYRFDAEDVSYVPMDAPSALGQLCVDAARAARLHLAGLDFRLDDRGRWWCLEMNPVPTFLPYEAGAGVRIGDAVVDLLLPGTRSAHDCSLLARRFEQA